MPPMARRKNQVKQMFEPYVHDDVPDHMPFPGLWRVATAKGDETAIPNLNQYQRSWILDVGLREVDLPSLSIKEAALFYETVKDKAFDAKAFKHVSQPGDEQEEAGLSALVAAWKRKDADKKRKKGKKVEAEAEDSGSDEEEDEDGRGALIRGYTKSGWRMAIQKVMSNKRGAEVAKLKMKKKPVGDVPEAPMVDAASLSKLVGLAAYSGRDKFREDRHDEIQALSKTLPGASNPGGKFRQAEAQLWAREDKAFWEAAAAIDEDVDWAERQQMVASGFRQMVDTLHSSGKFRPFVATMLMGWLNEDGKVNFEWQVVPFWRSRTVEAVPDAVHVDKPFKQEYGTLVDDSVNAMYAWAQKPLQNYVKSRGDTSKEAASPVFTLSMEAASEMSPKGITQAVSTFLVESYHAAFGTEDIPWPAIASEPDKYYDAEQFNFQFSPTGLGNGPLAMGEMYKLATALISVAGVGTSGFFRQAGRSSSPPPPPTPTRAQSPTRSESPRRSSSPPPPPTPPRAQSPTRSESPRRSSSPPPPPTPPRAQSPTRSESPRRSSSPPPPPTPPRAQSPTRSESPRRSASPPPPPPTPTRAQSPTHSESPRRSASPPLPPQTPPRAQSPPTTLEDTTGLAIPEKKKRGGKRNKAEMQEEEGQAQKKGQGTKRKAEKQLVPEEEGSGRHPVRARKTPAEVLAERAKRAAEAATKPKAKPGRPQSPGNNIPLQQELKFRSELE
ncbi:hypothetical protein C8R43DRAFT_954609 [Mycena crocata]|nr:hypothetical protein C8R43DRAFT_954609 [Mycena crocata]